MEQGKDDRTAARDADGGGQDRDAGGAAKPRRGGKRPGAGRKKKGHQPRSALAEIDVRSALAAPAPEEIETRAQRRAREVIGALVKKLIHGLSESARVQAANAILDRGYGKPSVGTGGDPLLPFFGSQPVRDSAPEIRNEARKFANLAIEVLERIAIDGETEGASVTAAKSLLDRGCGTVAVAKVPDELAGLRKLGKKEQAERAADAAAVGRYAPPAPPKMKAAE